MFSTIFFYLFPVLLQAVTSSISALSSKDLRNQLQIFNGNITSGIATPTLNFYGKIISVCEFSECFLAVVNGGGINFAGNGRDLASIYVPSNDYDTWKQNIEDGDLDEGDMIEGDFVYQMQNVTLSCLTIQVKWSFGYRGDEIAFACSVIPLAANWDCHLDWAVTAECYFSTENDRVEAIYTVTNLGPEEEHGKPSILSGVQIDNEDPKFNLIRQKQ